ncbi:PAS domain-containing sensor histidine kinase [Halobaculum sp. MBLA0143]|uniref:PAS domain-containing sensor histidine kinase n=1 Tax=Halobaculum sp. MBLA0143 TaxID=3079933 RepID=UPI00352530D4
MLLLDVDGQVERVLTTVDEDAAPHEPEPMGTDVCEVVAATASDQFASALATLDESAETFRHDGVDGHGRFESRLSPAADGDGVVWNTRRVRRESDGLLERILATSPVGVVVVGADGEIETANERAQELLGLRREEITARTYTDPEWEITHDDGSPVANDEHPVTRVFETGEPVYGFEHWLVRPDGDRRWLSSNSAPITDDDGEVVKVVVGIEDTTDLKRRTERIRRLVATEEVADTGGWRYDPAADTVEQTAGTQLARQPDTVSLDAVCDEYDDDSGRRLRRAMSECLVDGEPFELELRRVGPPEGEAWVQVRGQRVAADRSDPLADGGLDHPVVAGVARDVTGVKRREQRLSVVNRVLRHNVRNKLNVVHGVAELLRDDDSDETTVQSRAETIERAAADLVSVADGIRAFQEAVASADDPAPTQLAPAVREVVDRYDDGDATFRLDCTDASVSASPQAVRLLVEVPVENAVEHAGPRPTVVVGCRRDGDTVEISVTDDGVGIPEGELRALRSDRETPVEHTSGVGLWTLRWLAGRLGGELRVTRPNGGGTAVSVRLPAA